ncbi:MAG: DUF5107 domain-containing protein [Draconibacterium sp.]|nr:DUF5107 domain-containing protein [Draconibacterium sp.]
MQRENRKEWKALILENEYIKLCVTPEIGGKLYYATDKTTDYNFVHHRASTMLPVDYKLVEIPTAVKPFGLVKPSRATKCAGQLG